MKKKGSKKKTILRLQRPLHDMKLKQKLRLRLKQKQKQRLKNRGTEKKKNSVPMKKNDCYSNRYRLRNNASKKREKRKECD